MRYMWPQAECLHEFTSSEARLVNGWGEVVKIIPERCLDCGYKFPTDSGDTPQPNDC